HPGWPTARRRISASSMPRGRSDVPIVPRLPPAVGCSRANLVVVFPKISLWLTSGEGGCRPPRSKRPRSIHVGALAVEVRPARGQPQGSDEPTQSLGFRRLLRG